MAGIKDIRVKKGLPHCFEFFCCSCEMPFLNEIVQNLT